MRTNTRIIVALGAAALVCSAAMVSADILVMRDGRRIDGQLISVQRGVIEFREGRGSGSRTLEVQRDQVERIEFDEPRRPDDRAPDRLPGRGMGRPRGLREAEVWVAANRAWTDAGIDVRDGQVLYFDAHGGDIQWRPGASTRAGGDPQSTYSSRRPMPDRPIGALIGRIGSSGRYFFIGEEDGPIRVRESGRLFLGINDDNVSDNRGAFRVTVSF